MIYSVNLWLLFLQVVCAGPAFPPAGVSVKHSAQMGTDPIPKIFNETEKGLVIQRETGKDSGEKRDAPQCPSLAFLLGRSASSHPRYKLSGENTTIMLISTGFLDRSMPEHLSEKTLTACVSAAIIALPVENLGCVAGTISEQNGLSLNIDIHLFKGTVNFYKKDEELWMQYDIKYYYSIHMHQHLEGDVALVPM